MEFLDEDARPRFLFQSKAPNSSFADPEEDQKKLSKPFIFITISISSLLLVSSIFFVQSEPSKSLLLWVALSILLGPFAPISITGGDIRVGRGPILDLPDETLQSDEETKKKAPQKRSKPRRSEETGFDPAPVIETTNGSAKEQKKNVGNSNGGGAVVEEEKDWNEEDIEILKKQLLKNPVGKPKRWEVIAEAFRGRHKVDSVIKKAKELGEKRSDDGDSYAQFLKKRKPVDKRADGGNEGSEGGGGGGGFTAEEGESRKENWSSAEDIALLNALKAFPKEVSMRWEKIAAAVPGKSKAGCIKRVSELKKDFRSSKAATEA